MICLISGFISSVTHGYHGMEWALNLSRRLVTPTAFAPLLRRCILQAIHCCRLKGLQLGDIDDYPSLLAVCTVPPSNMKASQYE